MLKKLTVALPKGFLQNASVCIIFSLIAANSTVLGFASPISVAVCTVLSLPLSFVFSLSTLLWVIVFGINAHSLGTAFSAIIVCLIRCLKQNDTVKKYSFTRYAYSFFIYLICTVVLLVLFSSSFTDYLVAIIFSFSIPTLIMAYNNRSSKQMISFLFVAAISTLASLDLVYLNIGRALGIYSVLAIGFFKGAAYSCFVGILCSIAIALYNPDMFSSTVFVCIIGIICSGRGYKDKVRLPLYAVATSVICAFVSGADNYEIGFVVDTLVAVAAFVFTEDKVNALIARFAPKSKAADSFLNVVSSYSQSRVYSLSSLNRYIKSLSSAAALYKPLDISSGIYSGICLSCSNHDRCFFDKSLEFSKAIKGCSKPNQLINYAEKLKDRNSHMKILSSKRLAKFNEAQSALMTINDYINDSSKLCEDITNLDLVLTKKLAVTLTENKAEASNFAVFEDKSLFVEYSKHKRISEVRLCLLVSELMSHDYSMPEVIAYDNTIRYSFYPKPAFCADFGTVQVSANADGCGDSYDCFIHGNMLYYILCDGMGTGKEAKVSSSLLISLIKQQLMHDISSSAAISLSALLMRLIELDESFSTLDMLRVNLNTGKCEFHKSGCCKSYIIGEGIVDVPTGGYPIGILNEINVKQSNASVKTNTAIVMFTDGAKDIPYQLIEKTVCENFAVSSEEIAEKILENSQKALKHSQNDDVTIAVIKIENRTG